MQTPHRFRSKRQLWTYSGLGIETRDSAQYRYVRGQLQRTKKPQQIRGLNQNHNHEMKAAWAGIVFILLTTGVSGPRPTPLASGANVSTEVPPAGNRNDVKKMQQILWDKGHNRGEVNGVFGLRTWASIRGFQKAENLPVRRDRTRKYRCLLQPRGARRYIRISCGIRSYGISGRIKFGQHLFCGRISSSGCLL